MNAARRALAIVALCTLVLTLAAPARAVVAPQGGQSAYEIPLREFALDRYRSATTDAERSQVELGLTRTYGGTWTVYFWNPQSHTPSEMYGSGVDVAGALSSSENVRAAAEEIIQANPATFRADLAGLRFREATSSPPVTNAADGINRPGKWAAHFQQVYHGIDVVGGNVHMTFTDSGRLFALGSTCYSDISVDWNPSISSDRAKEIALHALPFNAATDSVEAGAKLLVLPVPVSETEVEHHLVWEVRVHIQEPVAIWITDVDAHNERILRRINDVRFDYSGTAAGQVERTSFCDGTHQEAYPYLYVSVPGAGATYADAAGNWFVPSWWYWASPVYSHLQSPYVFVQNDQGSSASFTGSATPGIPLSIVFDDSNSRADERDVYRTVNDIHDFFETFAPGFGFTDQSINALVNMNQTCNAYWNGEGIHFYAAGNNCNNTGQMMSIVAHEYGHGIQNAILGWQGDQGLGEGNGDITGFLLTRESIIGRGWNNCGTGYLRNCDNSLIYPDNVIGQEAHDAGRVIAGFHWDAMQAQIAAYGEWGHYSAAWDWHWGRVLQLPTDQPAQVLATFIANDNDGNLSNGTPQFNMYCLAATNHGFTCPAVTLPLSNAACDLYYQIPQGYQINQQTNYWTVVGVLPTGGDDKDMIVFTAGYGQGLAASTGTQGADFVVGDFNHNPMGVYQPYVTSGETAVPFVTEWDSGPDAITVGTDIYGSVGGGSGSCGAVRIWDIFLQAGQSCNFDLLNLGGTADMRVSLFRNPATSPYWAGRNASVFELPTNTPNDFVAPATDWYGVVVFNNSPGSPVGNYLLRVQNSPVAMASAVCQSWATSPKMFGFTQTVPQWTGVAVNPGVGDDKDIAIFADCSGEGDPLASSNETAGTDFVVGDFNHNATGTYYSQVSWGSPSASYVTEWDSGADVITIGTDVNGTVGGGSGACGLIQVSDVFLTEGQSYRFLLTVGSAADVRVALFRNLTDDIYWAGREYAEFEAGNTDGRTYTAPASDWYGVVVFNNSPGSPAGNYTLQVRNLSLEMASSSCQTASGTPRMFGFHQINNYWSAVAINPSGTDDKDVWIFDNPDGTGAPIGYSTGTEGTDYVISDFNHTPMGTYYAMATYGPPEANYVMEWDDGPESLLSGDEYSGTLGGGSGDCGLIRVWDVYLQAGTTYQFLLTAVGDAGTRVALFRNPGGAPYWAGRFNAQFEGASSPAPYSYTAPATDYYGLVVFNASPDSPAGTYTLRVDDPTTTGVEEAGSIVGKPGISFQNPYRAGSPIMLRASSNGTPAQIEIYNVQGRLVRTFSDAPVGKAGRQLRWDGRADGGSILDSGVYYVRARIGPMQVSRTMLLLR